jgi:hypothetical protein
MRVRAVCLFVYLFVAVRGDYGGTSSPAQSNTRPDCSGPRRSSTPSSELAENSGVKILPA